MSTPGKPGGIVFSVVGTSHGQYSTDAAGNTTEGYKLYIRLSTGATGTVFIPESQWQDQAAVEELVRQAAQTLAANSSLSGTLE